MILKISISLTYNLVISHLVIHAQYLLILFWSSSKFTPKGFIAYSCKQEWIPCILSAVCVLYGFLHFL